MVDWTHEAGEFVLTIWPQQRLTNTHALKRPTAHDPGIKAVVKHKRSQQPQPEQTHSEIGSGSYDTLLSRSSSSLVAYIPRFSLSLTSAVTFVLKYRNKLLQSPPTAKVSSDVNNESFHRGPTHPPPPRVSVPMQVLRRINFLTVKDAKQTQKREPLVKEDFLTYCSQQILATFWSCNGKGRSTWEEMHCH
jgi:predicted transcriptional regulator